MEAEEVFIRIDSKANTYEAYQTDIHLLREDLECLPARKPFERLVQYSDIVNIEIKYSDGSSEEISVNWDYYTSDDVNSYQTNILVGQAGTYIFVLVITSLLKTLFT